MDKHMSEVMKVVIKIVNNIKHNATKHRLFQSFLDELDAQYGDLLYYAKIRWLSRGKCLERFWNLREEIKTFLAQSEEEVPQLHDNQWLQDLCFLADITRHLNVLNLKLQGRDALLTDHY